MASTSSSFGPFVLDRARRVLLREGAPVALTPKAFDVLVALADRAGTVVRKDELFRAAWPDTIVDESNLAFQISTLRKALGERESGERYIVTVPGQGYQLIAPSRTGESSATEIVLEENETVTVTVQETSPAVRSMVAVLVSIIAIIMTAALAWNFTRRDTPLPAAAIPASSHAVRSMAILPFKPLVAAQKDEALQLGMADSLIGSVSKEHEVAVRPLSAVRRYGELEQDPVSAGRELQVDAVLDGTIHHADGRIRVTARLLRVADAKQLWEGRFDEELAGIFAVQDSISRRLASELSLGTHTRLVKRHTPSIEAYRAYALGVLHVQRLNREAIDTGIAHFRRATIIDPRYAAAHAAMANAFSILPVSSDGPPKESFRAAREAATKAIELDPDLAEAHLVLGTIAFWYDWDWAQADKHLQRALELEPGNAAARLRYAHFLSNIGQHDEARVQMTEALRLDPLSRLANTLAGQFHLQSGNVDAGISQLKHALRIDPEFWIAHLNLGKAYETQRRFEEALAELERAQIGAGQNVEPLAMKGYVHGLRGDRGSAQRVLLELMAISSQRPIGATKIALVHLGMGERAEALRWLRRACEERDVGLTFLRANPRWSQLRGEAEFRAIERCVNLPE